MALLPSLLDALASHSFTNIINKQRALPLIMSISESTSNNSRSERRRDETKRQIMGALKDSDDTVSTASSLHKPAEFLVKSLDGSNPDQVKLLIQDLREKVQQQQTALKAEAATGKKEQLGSHFAGMLKIPTKVKKMTVREFNKTHKCDLLQLVTSSMGGKKRVRPISKKDLETPAPTKLPGKAQATPSRTVKRGEALLYVHCIVL